MAPITSGRSLTRRCTGTLLHFEIKTNISSVSLWLQQICAIYHEIAMSSCLSMSMGWDCLWTVAISVCLSDGTWVRRPTMEWYWKGKTKELREKLVPVSLCPPEIPHGLTVLKPGHRDRPPPLTTHSLHSVWRTWPLCQCCLRMLLRW
jgi:hypothetical protein